MRRSCVERHWITEGPEGGSEADQPQHCRGKAAFAAAADVALVCFAVARVFAAVAGTAFSRNPHALTSYSLTSRIVCVRVCF